MTEFGLVLVSMMVGVLLGAIAMKIVHKEELYIIERKWESRCQLKYKQGKQRGWRNAKNDSK